MSRRDEAAASLLARHLPTLGPEGPSLVMQDPRPEVGEALAELGADPRSWHRRAEGGRPASPWPPPGPFATVLLRLPRAREELEMALHAAVSVLGEGGRLFVYGANDEGARSAAKRMEPLVGDVSTVAVGGRCRVLGGVRPGRVAGLRARLADWRRTFPVPLPEVRRPWASYPGVFAHGRLDEGTRLLVEALPPVPEGARVLDFGCGSGIVGAVVLARRPSARVDFLDVDAVALEAVQENVPEARTILADGPPSPPDARYDLVVSNPPCHRGKAETGDVLAALVARAPALLAPGGRLALVAQRRLPVPALLDASGFARQEVAADDGRLYRVWHARVSLADDARAAPTSPSAQEDPRAGGDR